MLAVDISNYTNDLTKEKLSCWRSHGVGLVIVQCVNPGPPYPPGKTREQLEILTEDSMPTHGYNYLWLDESVASFLNRYNLFNGYDLSHIWIDVEDNREALNYLTPEQRVTVVRRAVEMTKERYPEKTVGIYTGKWYWDAFMGNSIAFAEEPLWDSWFNGIADVNNFRPYGGWDKCLIKQHIGDGELCGVTGIDINVTEMDIKMPHPMEHLDAAWGALDRIQTARTWSKVRTDSQYAKDELINLKRAMGWGS